MTDFIIKNEMKIFIVLYATYDESYVLGAFTNKVAAQKFIDESSDSVKQNADIVDTNLYNN